MNIINCSPFNGNYLRTGSLGPACASSSCGSGCGCGCGCGCGSDCCCGCNAGCGCGCGCGCDPGCGCCGCDCCCNHTFIPTPEVPFPCIQTCAAQNASSACGCGSSAAQSCGCGSSAAQSCGCGSSAAQSCGCGSGSAQSCGCGCGSGSGCVYNPCADAVALLDHPCYGLSSIKNELDAVACTVGEIYNLMAPVPCNPSPRQCSCGC